VEHDIGDDAIAEHDEDRSAEELGEKRRHGVGEREFVGRVLTWESSTDNPR
jgi:hypothetical protein